MSINEKNNNNGTELNKSYAELSFEELSKLLDGYNSNCNEVSKLVAQLESKQENRAYRIIYNSFFIRIVKKVIRKLVKWYVEPIADQQTIYNTLSTATIKRISENLSKISNFEKEHIKIEKKIDRIINEHETEMKNLYNELEKNYVERTKETTTNYEKLKRKINLVDENTLSHEQILSEIKKETKKIVQNDSRDYKTTYNYIGTKLLLFEDRLANLEKPQHLEENYIKKVENFFNKKTYSQSGEDSICAYIINMLSIPFQSVTYLDLGANDPILMSNTYLFYKLGAKGVLVEANPNLIGNLSLHRSNDLILNKIISNQKNTKEKFYIFNGDGLSTTDYSLAKQNLEKNKELKIVEEVFVDTISITDIYNNYFTEIPTILNVDLEMDVTNILESIDWEKYRPLIVILEMIDYEVSLVTNEKNMKLYEFMLSIGYIEYSYTGINSIFIDNRVFQSK